MSRAGRLLELVRDLDSHTSEVVYGNCKLLYCWHVVMAFSDGQFVWATTDNVTPEIRAAINKWAGKPTLPMSQKDLEQKTYMMARAMESVEIADGTRVSVNPRNVKRMEKELRLGERGLNGNHVRFLVSEDGDMYFWASYDRTHEFAANALGVSYAFSKRGELDREPSAKSGWKMSSYVVDGRPYDQPEEVQEFLNDE